MDHREFEVRRRVVHRDSRVLRQVDDHERGQDEDYRRKVRAQKRRVPEASVDSAERYASGDRAEPGHAEQQRRLAQRREKRLAVRAHPLEARPRVERGQNREETPEGEKIRHQQNVAFEMQQRGVPPERDQAERAEHRRQRDDRPGPEHPCRRRAVHRALAKQPREAPVGLEQRRPLPSGHARLRPVDERPQERRENQREGHAEKRGEEIGDHSRLQTSTATSARTT